MADHITTEQILNLADRAETGRLSTAEADRLRRGIRQLDDRHRATEAARRSTALRLRYARTHGRDDRHRMDAVRALVHSTRHRGGRTVLVTTLAAILTAPIEMNESQQEAA
ncbi:hypothetical protein [Streptomyces sp. CS081A]|uniref:hypothetical protein n=1 Tax=Streptomyces sp. CS081A TaxID=2162709 RepID=UPI000D50D140|nr:hypothetical protein [Streptomyces sp. CS081A]PVC73500.1 hypothetical protein DBP18_14230 [Streptomyces sp. CS081A]